MTPINALQTRFARFWRDDSAAAAVDWVVVLAAASSLGVGAAASIGAGAMDLGRAGQSAAPMSGQCAETRAAVTCISARPPMR
ncbi:MAG: hypothetical protein Kow0013_26300 [Pararhodobacter sp.]